MKFYNIESKYNLTKLDITNNDENEVIINASNSIPSLCEYIDYMWIIDEDGIAIFNNKKYEVKANQLIVLCYPINPKEDPPVYIIDIMPEALLEFVRKKEEYERQKISECDSCCKCAK